jgi:hypothetical protein
VAYQIGSALGLQYLRHTPPLSPAALSEHIEDGRTQSKKVVTVGDDF